MIEAMKFAGYCAVDSLKAIYDEGCVGPKTGEMTLDGSASVATSIKQERHETSDINAEARASFELLGDGLKAKVLITTGSATTGIISSQVLLVDIHLIDSDQKLCFGIPFSCKTDEKEFEFHVLDVRESSGFSEEQDISKIAGFFAEGMGSHEDGMELIENNYSGVKFFQVDSGYTIDIECMKKDSQDTLDDINTNEPDFGITPSSEDYVILSHFPAVVFLQIAAADGSIDKKEVKAFIDLLMKIDAENCRSIDLCRKVLIADFSSILEKILKDPDLIGEVTEASMEIIEEKMNSIESLKFRKFMLTIAREVASASGGFLGIFGSKIGKQEKAAIESIKSTLKLA